jgi:bla regulator protein blaR1
MMGSDAISAGMAVASGLANHLWQSTLVALSAGLLTLTLRKHPARVRYWIWSAASLKFLIPFSLLIALGRRLSWTRHLSSSSGPDINIAIGQIGQPFSQPAFGLVAAPNSSMAAFHLAHLIPFATVLWLSGMAAVMLLWVVRWQRISAAIKNATPLTEGREIEALRRVERSGGLRDPIPLLLSCASLEPGVFGIARPTLIWPEGISKRLDEAQLEAILAHEAWHVRRRDNLSAACHMLVEAAFWFYPLVWWLGARLVEERERACDEEVVALGSDRQVYAESILKVCEFCLGLPLPCVSGISGADLKKRMVYIMNDRMLHNLSLPRKLLLTAAAVLAVALPVLFGLFDATASQAQSESENATVATPIYSSLSIKPSAIPEGDNRIRMMFSLKDGNFEAQGVTLQRLIQMAYDVQDAQISGASELLLKPKYDIEAKLDPAYVAAKQQEMAEDKHFGDRALVKSILTDRFKLVTSSQPQMVAAYDLVIGESGSKLEASTGEMHMMQMGIGQLVSSGAALEFLVGQLSLRLGKPVVDRTGLKGNYAFNLHWTPDATERERLQQSGAPLALGGNTLASPDGASDSKALPLPTALEEQLGLKLQPQTESVKMLVVEHVEQPAAN